ncbi:MAG: hypothetical protein M3N42_14725, partial [Cyanobacteriota bacterium]|nr:hypothetical protein [Cyanobacteriota bacterium]
SRRLGTGREEQSSCSLGEVVGQPPFGSSQLKAILQRQPRICNRSRVRQIGWECRARISSTS